jgi:threonine/homoserine/homoserine lactone efflux protein
MNIIGFLGAAVLLTLMPGPDIIFVISQSISNGKKSGVFIALGLCTGLIVHTTAASLGVSLILYKSALAFEILKYLGAGYLIFLGIQSILQRNKELIRTDTMTRVESGSLYRKGILMNILNPKVSLFFLAFLPQFVVPGSISPSLQMFFLGALFIIQALIVFSIVSFAADKFTGRIMQNPKFSGAVTWIKSSIYFTIGINLALAKR